MGVKWWEKFKSKTSGLLDRKSPHATHESSPAQALVPPPAAVEDGDDRTGLSRPRGMGGRKSINMEQAPGAAGGLGPGRPPDGAHETQQPGSGAGATDGVHTAAGTSSAAAPHQSPSAVDPQQPAPASPRAARSAAPSPNGAAPAAAPAPAQQEQAQPQAQAAPQQQPHRASRGGHGHGGSGGEAHAVPKDEDLGSCPPFGTKAVWGLRYTMEDKWAAVPNMIQVPLDFASPARRAPGVSAACGCIGGLARISGGRLGGGGGGDAAGGEGEADALVGGGRSSSHRPDAAATDALHYFGVYDGHGGAEAAKHCAARMHHVLLECIRAALDGDEDAFAPAGGAAAAAEAEQQQQAAQQQQQQQQQAAQQQREQDGAAPQSGLSADRSQSSTSSGSPSAAPPPPAPPPPLLAPAPDGEWLQAVLARAFVALDHEFAVVSEGSYVGTTAVVVLLSSQRIWVAHCGDSRAVLGRGGAAMALTQDHKASRDDEVARVQAAGGHVWWDRVMGELAVSRAIGDHCLRPYVIPEPEVCMLERSTDDECLILASDGLWDVLSNQEAADMALHRLHAAEAEGLTGVAAARKAASALTKAALERGTRDNVTVLVVDMRHERAVAGAGAGPAAASPDNASAKPAGEPRAAAAPPAAAAAAPPAAPATGDAARGAGASSSRAPNE